jgi:hypothetical protein
MRVSSLCILISSLLFSAPLWALDSMRCGTKLVTTGDTKAEVLARCGEPELKEVLRSVTKTNKFRAGEKNQRTDKNKSDDKETAQQHTERSEFSRMTETTELVEQWTYDPGYGKFLRLVIFRGGRLESIQEGPRSTEIE